MIESSTSIADASSSKADFYLSLLGALLPGLYLLTTSTTLLVTAILPYDFKRILQLLLLASLLCIPLISKRVGRELDSLTASFPRWLGIAFLLAITWGTASAIVNAQSSMHLASSLADIELFSLLLLTTVVVAACRRVSTKRFDQVAIGLVALTGLGVGFQELIGVAAACVHDTALTYDNALMYFAHPRFYNQVQSWMVPVLPALPLLFGRSRPILIVCATVLGLQWYILLMTGARGSFVSISMAVVIAAVLLPSTRKQQLLWQFAGLAIGAAIYAVVLLGFENVNAGHPELVDQSTNQSKAWETHKSGIYGNEDGAQSPFLAQSLGRPMTNSTGRIRAWKGVLDDAVSHPVFGMGPMYYACATNRWFGHPHNFLLQVIAEWGWLAALLLFGAFGWLTLKALDKIRKGQNVIPKDNVFAGLVFTAVISASIHSCVSGIMVMPASQVTGSLLCGTLAGLMVSPDARRNVARSWLPISGLILAWAMITWAVVELSTMEMRASRLDPHRIVAPRMWQDSKVCLIYTRQTNVNN